MGRMGGCTSAAGAAHRVEPATAEDSAGIVRALTGAFADYPWTSWIVPAESHEARLSDLFALTVSQVGLPFGHVWVVRCPTSSEVAGAVVALRPDQEIPDDVGARLATRERELMGDRLAAAEAAEAACAPLRPTDPHVTVATIGVHPSHQRRGLATALMNPVLHLADDLALPTYLETSSPANLAFYRRHGFATTGEVTVADGGPVVWAMARKAGSAIDRIST